MIIFMHSQSIRNFPNSFFFKLKIFLNLFEAVSKSFEIF